MKRFTRTLDALFRQPQLSLSAALGSGLRRAAGDLFQHVDTRVAHLLAGHVAATAQRCGGYDGVVVSQDTTCFTYGQDQIVGLGPLNGTARGMVGHTALAPSRGDVPPGLLVLRPWGDTVNPLPGCPVQPEPEVVRCESAKCEVTPASLQETLPAGLLGISGGHREGAEKDRLFSRTVVGVAVPQGVRVKPEPPDKLVRVISTIRTGSPVRSEGGASQRSLGLADSGLRHGVHHLLVELWVGFEGGHPLLSKDVGVIEVQRLVRETAGPVIIHHLQVPRPPAQVGDLPTVC